MPLKAQRLNKNMQRGAKTTAALRKLEQPAGCHVLWLAGRRASLAALCRRVLQRRSLALTSIFNQGAAEKTTGSFK